MNLTPSGRCFTSRFSFLLLTLFICIHFEPKANADVVTIGSLNDSISATSQAFANSLNSIGIAQSFKYSSNFTLTGVKLNLFNTSLTNAGSYTISLYSDNNNSPVSGTSLGSGLWGTLHGTNSSNSIVVTGLNTALTANTQYWIGVTSDSGGLSRQWAFKDTNLFENNSSRTDIAFYNGATFAWTNQGSGHAMGLEINGVTSVPEPSTLILTGFALVAMALGAYSNRHRKTQAAIVS